jgi:hypothetical protein
MSIFDQEETLCNREANTCKLRYKCLRYLKTQGDQDWCANYWQEFGRLCPHHVPLKKEKVIVKGLPETKDDKGS